MKKSRTRRQRAGEHGPAAQTLRERLEAEGKVVVTTPPGVPKASDVFVEFSEPFLDMFRREGRVSPGEFERALQLTAVVWNAALLPGGDDLLRQVRGAFAGAPLDVRQHMGAMIDGLIERRRTTYAHDRRMIGDFQVAPGVPGEMRVSVAYASLPLPAARA